MDLGGRRVPGSASTQLENSVRRDRKLASLAHAGETALSYCVIGLTAKDPTSDSFRSAAGPNSACYGWYHAAACLIPDERGFLPLFRIATTRDWVASC